jgi:hypothetical protein
MNMKDSKGRAELSSSPYELRPAQSPADWRAYHAIRRDSIFESLLPGQPYDEFDAAEFTPGHMPTFSSAPARSSVRCAST